MVARTRSGGSRTAARAQERSTCRPDGRRSPHAGGGGRRIRHLDGDGLDPKEVGSTHSLTQTPGYQPYLGELAIALTPGAPMARVAIAQPEVGRLIFRHDGVQIGEVRFKTRGHFGPPADFPHAEFEALSAMPLEALTDPQYDRLNELLNARISEYLGSTCTVTSWEGPPALFPMMRAAVVQVSTIGGSRECQVVDPEGVAFTEDERRRALDGPRLLQDTSVVKQRARQRDERDLRVARSWGG